MKHKLALIIPTKDRPAEVMRLLESVKEQSVKPDEIIIVDGSGTPNAALNIEEFSGVRIKYKHILNPQLTKQRNLGLTLLDESIEFVGFLDDDIVFCEDAIKNMLSFWKEAPQEMGATAFNIINEKRPTPLVFLKLLFYTGTSKRGVVLRSGYCTLGYPTQETRMVQWIGCATVWRRKIFDEFLFDEWYEKTGLCEDLDFSYRVSKKYQLAVVADSKVLHLTIPVKERKGYNFDFGVTQIHNRLYFVKKNLELSVGLCLWAGIGQLIENIVRGVFTLNKGYLVRAYGNVVGLFIKS
ncbi:MAG: glycosyltransferase family 2 protein [Candidatus Omnitrophica bacterium]|nr:glycosyltransferase family 2 protein [Candidatus Omnitrophota bacterium]